MQSLFIRTDSFGTPVTLLADANRNELAFIATFYLTAV